VIAPALKFLVALTCLKWRFESCVIFGQPFVKRFALCYRSVVCPVCLSVLSVTFVHCGQTVGRIKMKFGVQIGLGPGHIVLDGDQLPLPQGGTALTQFSAHICCGQMAAWIKMSLGMKLGLSPGDFVLDGDPALPSPKKGQSTPPQFLAHFYCGKPAACIKMPLIMEVCPQPRGLCVRWGPSPP